jgi:hypothetical protein
MPILWNKSKSKLPLTHLYEIPYALYLKTVP